MTRPDFTEPPNRITEKDRARIRAQHHAWLCSIGIAAIDGALIGLTVGLTLLFLDIHGIGSMLSRSEQQTGFTLLLLAGFAHTFSMVSAGMSIWLKATQEEEK